MVRAIALSIALLIGVGSLVPLATEHAEAGTTKIRKYKKKRYWKGVKKYSKRWWQLYRAQERRKKILAAKRRSLRLNQMRYAKAREAANNDSTNASVVMPKAASVIMPSGESAPRLWKVSDNNSSEVRFMVDNAGSAAISVVGTATGESVTTGRNQAVGGVATASLRREVINQMVRENGWVVNDYQKEIGGKTVYIVVAQSQEASGNIQSRMFYFTASNGRIYSVSTNSAPSSAERVAVETENVIRSLQTRFNQQAAKE